MNEGYYTWVFAIPYAIVFSVLASACFILNHKMPNSIHWLTTYAFPGIIEKKTDENGRTAWQVKDTDLGEGSELLSKLTKRFSFLFFTLTVNTSMMFFHLLLINVSYDCDPDEKSKDCFEFKFGGTDRYSNVPINCSSAAILNGSVKVVCYEIVFDFSRAVGASYGVFKISMGGLQLLATLIVTKKNTKLITNMRIVTVFALLGFLVVIFVVEFTDLRVFLVSNTFVTILQAAFIFAAAVNFAFLVPWNDLIEKMDKRKVEGVINPALEPDNSNIAD